MKPGSDLQAVSFDPFNDFETRGYLRNVFGEKDPNIIKHLEHSSFVAGISETFKYLGSIRDLSYRDVLHTHKLLFGDVYPWAAQDRAVTAPNIAVSKGRVLFAHRRSTSRPRIVNGNPRAKCDNRRVMARPAKITTAFPSVLETAKRLGVSKHDAEVLSEMAERSERTGKFVIPGLGHLVRVGRKYRTARNPATGEKIRIPAKKVVKFRVAKSPKDAIAPSTKK